MFRSLEKQYRGKSEEILYDVINKINNSLLRRLSPLLQNSTARVRDANDIQVEDKIERL